VAPGIDVERDVLALLPAGVRVPAEPARMDAAIFSADAFGVKRR